MKKLLIVLSLLLILCSCQKKENIEKFYLNDSYYGSSEIRDNTINNFFII